VLAIIWCKIFCLPVCYTKITGSDIQNCNFLCCLYGCENWLLTLREERRMYVFENRVLMGIFGAKRYKVTGE
jgi:hypothetical protein